MAQVNPPYMLNGKRYKWDRIKKRYVIDTAYIASKINDTARGQAVKNRVTRKTGATPGNLQTARLTAMQNSGMTYKQQSQAKPAASTSSSSKSSGAKTTGGGVKKPAVSQSRTMWVKKGDVVNGKTVNKGYLAQYGKPEKKVNNRVEMVTGPKTGKKIEYKQGRRVTKKGK